MSGHEWKESPERHDTGILKSGKSFQKAIFCIATTGNSLDSLNSIQQLQKSTRNDRSLTSSHMQEAYYTAMIITDAIYRCDIQMRYTDAI